MADACITMLAWIMMEFWIGDWQGFLPEVPVSRGSPAINQSLFNVIREGARVGTLFGAAADQENSNWV